MGRHWVDKLTLVSQHQDPLAELGPALVCALIAQLVSVLLAAALAAKMPGGYRVRSWVFLAALSWSLAGTVLLLIRTAGSSRSGNAGQIGFGRIALWLVSSWVWPILVRRQRPTPDDTPPG
jgi:hypothetical protein